MPAEYLHCKESYVSKGIPEKEAKARCAASYFKRHGITVKEAEKRGMAGDLDAIELEMAANILSYALPSQGMGEANPTVLATPGTPDENINANHIVEGGRSLAITERLYTLGGESVLSFGEDGLLTIVAAKIGSAAYIHDPKTHEPKKVRWSKRALEKMALSWIGGRVNANHENSNEGVIVTSRFDGLNLVQTVRMSDTLRLNIDRNWPDVGVSTEAMVSEFENDEILNGEGFGVAFVFYPKSPACTQDEGCKILAEDAEHDHVVEASELWGVEDGTYWDDTVAKEFAESAKLTTKERNKLPGRSFCGPDRSFPAHDAAHVRNGLARLPQSNFGPAVKAKIKACLTRRAKRFDIKVTKGEMMTEEDCGCGSDCGCESDHATKLESMKAEYEAKLRVIDEEAETLRTYKQGVEEERRKTLLASIEGIGVKTDNYKDIPLEVLAMVAEDLRAIAEKNESAVGSGAKASDGATESEEELKIKKMQDEFVATRRAEALAIGQDPETYGKVK